MGMVKVTCKQVKKDLEHLVKFMKQIDPITLKQIDPTFENDSAAWLTLKQISGAEERLNTQNARELIEYHYFRKSFRTDGVPKALRSILKEYLDGIVTSHQAMNQLELLRGQYLTLFSEMEIKPRKPYSALPEPNYGNN